MNRFGVFVWPFLTLFMTRNGNTATQAGIAVSAYSVGSFAAAWLGGWMADRLGRNVTMGLASFGGAICMLAMSQATSWQALTALAFLTGMVAEAGTPAGAALVQDIVPAELRIAAFAVLRFAVNLGWSLGPICAGILAEHSFFWLFMVDAATSAFFGFVAWRYLPRGRRTEAHLAGWGVAWASIRQNAAFLALFVACVCGAWSFRQTATTFMLHLEHAGHPLSWSGIILAINGVMICTLEVPLAVLTSRLSARAMLAIGYTLMGACYLVLLGATPLWMFMVVIAVFTAGEMFTFSRHQAYASSLAPEDMRGRYAGFLSFAWAIGGIISSSAGLFLYEKSPASVWVVSAVLGVVASAIILAVKSPNEDAQP